MNQTLLKPDFPAPAEGFLLTHFLVVRDQDRSRDFYCRLFDATVVNLRDPVMLRVANSWLILNVGGEPTDDKPDTVAAPPEDDRVLRSAINIRVADVEAVYRDWTAKGATFLTPPKDHGDEIRCYLRDPDGHLVEVGQTTGGLNASVGANLSRS